MFVRVVMSLVFALMCAGAAQAGDVEDADAAFVKKDYATALTKWRSAAQQGSASAQFSLGLMYDEGKGVAQDFKEAVRWYKLAAAQGNAKAQFNLGISYGKGEGVAQD